MGSDGLITRLEQVTEAWLTHVVSTSNGLWHGHGDVNRKHPRPLKGVRPLYIIDRQPFNQSLADWLGAMIWLIRRCRTGLRPGTHPCWMSILQQTLTAVDDLRCANLLQPCLPRRENLPATLGGHSHDIGKNPLVGWDCLSMPR